MGLLALRTPDLPDLGTCFPSSLLHRVSGLVFESSPHSLCLRASTLSLVCLCVHYSLFSSFLHPTIVSSSYPQRISSIAQNSRFVSLSLAQTPSESTKSPPSIYSLFKSFNNFPSFQVDPRPLRNLQPFQYRPNINRVLRSFATVLIILLYLNLATTSLYNRPPNLDT